MKVDQAKPVYVIGAGFSAGLDYPLTANLLMGVWGRLSNDYKDRLGKVIKFHHPSFDPDRNTSFPYIEELLTEISVNEDMFRASRLTEGSFTRKSLQDVRAELLTEVALWFHELYPEPHKFKWLTKITNRIRREKATVISFNWDLVLDQRLFDKVAAKNYGFGDQPIDGPILLKPHGSLNWYEADDIDAVDSDKRILIYKTMKGFPAVELFRPHRHINSKSGKRYTPLIVPPTFIKDFRRPISVKLWQHCTEVLSRAKEIVVLGYSLPQADLQAKFIFRCGFHNQIEGTIQTKKNRNSPSGRAKITVVNPDSSSAKRIEATVGGDADFEWKAMKVEDWAKTL